MHPGYFARLGLGSYLITGGTRGFGRIIIWNFRSGTDGTYETKRPRRRRLYKYGIGRDGEV